jgi:microcystin-dependent protein
MKTFLLILLAYICVPMAYAQVGFGNPAPDPSAILDLTAVDKGLLIPRLTKPQREAMLSPARGLLVFDTDDNKFYFFNSSQWYALNEWTRASGSNDAALPGNASVGSLSVTGFATNALIPTGGIIMWSGVSVPTGWALCNGSNGTPDLRDRFIVGSGSSYNIGNTGGKNSITAGELPAHNHTGTTASSGSHSHTINGETMQKEGTSTQSVKVLSTGADTNHGAYTEPTTVDGAHTHTFTTSTSGTGTSADIRPLYYALAFIMKLP